MVKRKMTRERHYKRWLITRDEAPHERQRRVGESRPTVRQLVTTTSGEDQVALRDVNLDLVEEHHLRALVSASVSEGRAIEYKRDLPRKADADGKEFLADVCSFANAGGGDLLYGVEDVGGVAVSVPGVSIVDPDAEVLRLDSIIRSGLDPRLMGYRIRTVSLSGSAHVLIVRVPRSFGRPHAVDYKGRFRFYSRGSAGKFEMDVAEVRSSMIGSESLAERVRSFRAERLAAVAADQAPSPLNGRGIVVLHVLSLSAFDSPAPQVDLQEADREHSALLKPGALRSGDAPRYNFDGLLRVGRIPVKGPQTYVQLFRSGAVEMADAYTIDDREEGTPGTIPSIAFERYLLEALPMYLELQEKLKVNPPVLVMLSLLGVRGYEMLHGGQIGAPIDRENLLVAEVLFKEFETDRQAVATRVRPIFDAVWNACVYPRSPNYGPDGRWRESIS
jgi:hypothetical protein